MSFTLADLDNLRHMLGAEPERPRKSWGFRNYFCAGDSDVPSMERLVVAGWALNRGARDGSTYYSATRAGCVAVGMRTKEIDRMEPKP